MKFDREKSFGYPTLRTVLEGDDFKLLDYPNKTFDPDIKGNIDASDSRFLNIEYEIGLRVEALIDLIERKKAKFHFKIECPSTFFCEAFSSFDDEGTFQLSAEKLKDRIDITPFVIADTDLELSSDEIHEDFEGQKFDISRGSVLAIGRPTEYHISREQFRSVRSIFEFHQNEDVEPGEFRIRTDENYVTIEVNPTVYMSVKSAEQDRPSRLLILNSLYVPVVMHLLYELKQDPDLAENKRWAGTIVGKANQKGLNIEDDNALVLNAQKLLDMPFGKLAANGFRSGR